MNGKLYIKGKTVGDFSYMDGDDITKVHLKEGIYKIGDMAFCRCSSLKSIHLPKSLEIIGINAIVGTNITTLKIPDNVVFIDAKAFAFNHRLRSVHIGKNVEFIMPGAFSGCSSLEEITVDKGNPFYFIKSGCLIEKRSYGVVASLPPYIVPIGVKEIEERTFMFLTNCESVTILDPETKINMHGGYLKNFYVCRYTEYNEKGEAQESKPLTIRAPRRSYAERVAKEQNIKFEEI
jgi:hypothetical protein